MFQMAVFGACRCCEVGPGPCTCAQMAAQMIQDIARLNNKVGYLAYFLQWRRQLWGTGARAPPRLPTISFLVHFGVNLTANYPSIV